MKNLIITAAVAAGVIFNIFTGTAVEEIPAPVAVETVQEVTAVEHSEEITPRDEITVEAAFVRTAVEIIAEADTPLEPISAGSEILEPVTLDAEIPATDTPAICEPGWTLAEDGSCVNPGFYDDVDPGSAIGPFYDLGPCVDEDSMENCYWDASERGNGQGVDFVVFNGQVFYPEG